MAGHRPGGGAWRGGRDGRRWRRWRRWRRRRRRGGRLGGAGAGAGRARLPAIHLGLDRGPPRRHGQPRQPAAQRGDDPAGLRAVGTVDDRRLAAAVPRHGADRQRAAAPLPRRAVRADVADGVPAAAGPLAAGDQPLPRDHQRRTEFRLRAVRRAADGGGAPGARPRLLGGGFQRRRAGARGVVGALRRGVRALRLPAGIVLPVLWAGRGHAVRDRR